MFPASSGRVPGTTSLNFYNNYTCTSPYFDLAQRPSNNIKGIQANSRLNLSSQWNRVLAKMNSIYTVTLMQISFMNNAYN